MCGPRRPGGRYAAAVYQVFCCSDLEFIRWVNVIRPIFNLLIFVSEFDAMIDADLTSHIAEAAHALQVHPSMHSQLQGRNAAYVSCVNGKHDDLVLARVCFLD